MNMTYHTFHTAKGDKEEFVTEFPLSDAAYTIVDG